MKPIEARALLYGLSILLSMGFNSPAKAEIESKDPYALIERIVEPNGLEVYFSPQPNAKNFQISIEVKAGHASESKELAGVSHLLEHSLFTDARLENNLTYLEVIREKGGNGNGETSQMKTKYYATVPAAHANWLVSLFSRMLLKRKFTQAQIDQARKPVIIEIGKPDIYDYFAESWLGEICNLDIFRTAGFWESEFGIYHKTPSRADGRFNAERLSASDVQSYYEKYYYPKNITLFVSGNFNIQTLKQTVQTAFGAGPLQEGQTLDDWPKVVSSDPVNYSYAASETPRIIYGIKVWDLTLKDELAMRVYLDYVAHRLMKEIRNKRGQTYTASVGIGLNRNFGFGSISMDVPADSYASVLKYLKTLIRDEATNGGLSKAQFEEATQLYSSNFQTKERDSSTAMNMAEELYNYQRAYGEPISPYLVFKDTNFDEFVASLKRIFVDSHRYSTFSEPPLIFRYEGSLIQLLAIIALFVSAERLFTVPFEHGKLRLARKLTFPPAYLLQVSVTIIAIFVGYLVTQYCDAMGNRFNWFRSTFVLADYFERLVFVGAIFLSTISILSSIKRKIVVCGDFIYIKSLTYRSERIAIDEVETIELLLPKDAYFSIYWLSRIKYRFYNYNYKFWRPGLCLSTYGGKTYFFGFEEAQAVKDELENIMRTQGIQNNQGNKQAA